MPTSRRSRPAEQRAALEARRLQAAELFAQGRTQAEVAHTLGVSRQSAHVWHARFTQGGVEALRSRGPTGPDPKLLDAQLAQVEQALLQGAMANGFDTDLWTLERVAVVITQLTGVRYHPGHVEVRASVATPSTLRSTIDEYVQATASISKLPTCVTSPTSR
jgi:transposase